MKWLQFWPFKLPIHMDKSYDQGTLDLNIKKLTLARVNLRL
jgi:hypothetical protein